MPKITSEGEKKHGDKMGSLIAQNATLGKPAEKSNKEEPARLQDDDGEDSADKGTDFGNVDESDS